MLGRGTPPGKPPRPNAGAAAPMRGSGRGLPDLACCAHDRKQGQAGGGDGGTGGRTGVSGGASLAEAAPPPAEWDEAAYLAANPDVVTAVLRGIFRSGFEHFVRYGRQEGRPGVALPALRAQAAARFVEEHAFRAGGRATAEAIAEELIAAMRRAGAAAYGTPGWSLPSLPDPLVIPLDGAGGALRDALAALGTVIAGEAGPGTRLILDRSDLRRGTNTIQLNGFPGGLVAFGRGAAILGPVRLEGPDQTFILGDTAQADQNFGPVALRGRHAGIAIGRGCSANGALMLVDGDGTGILVGDDCMFAHGVEIAATDSHGIVDLASGRLLNPPAGIAIGPHVWLGAHSRVLKGVSIGAGAVVAMGAVVTRDVPPAALAAGIPARVTRRGLSWTRRPDPDPAQAARLAAWLAAPGPELPEP